MTVTRRQLLHHTAAGSMILAGCTGGGNGGSGGDSSRTSTVTSSPTETPTATATPAGENAQEQYPDYSWGTLENTDPVPTETVTLQKSMFDPLIVAVKPGTEITFINEDSYGHTVTIPKLDVDKQMDGGQSATMNFEETGTYNYVCTFHPPDMLGRLKVTENLPEKTSTEMPTESPTPTEDGDGGYY